MKELKIWGCISMKRPLGITLIGYFYIFGAAVLLLTLGVKQDLDINLRFGVPFLPETATRVFVAIFSIIMAYGYLNLKKWGYWAMIIYSVIFLIISAHQALLYGDQLFKGNIIFSMLVILYTYANRHSFNNNINKQRFHI